MQMSLDQTLETRIINNLSLELKRKELKTNI